MRRILLFITAALVATGCAEKDTTAPPAPNVDPIESPTATAKLTVSGSAEYGSTIKISGGVATVETTADAFTARFRAEVELKPDADNTLSFTATDASGNASPATEVKVVHADGFGIPAQVKVELFKNAETTALVAPATVAVGDSVRIQVTVSDKKGNKLDHPVDINTDAPGSLLEGITLTNLLKAGDFKIVATARDTPLFASARLVVGPGAPTRLTLTAATNDTVAGTQVALTPKVTDAAGNEVTDIQVALSVAPALAAQFTIPNTSPAQTVSQGLIGRQFVAYDLSSAQATSGTFTITATANGGALTASTQITVRPAAGQRFQTLQYVPSGTSLAVAAGTDVQYTYQVVDLYGNPTDTRILPFSNAPGAFFVDDGVSGSGRLTGLTAVGNFTLSFYISGAGLKGALQLAVGTGPVATVTASTAASLVAPNSDVKAFAQVRDAFGNRILCTTATAGDVVFTALANGGQTSAPTAPTCFNGAFQATFRFTTEDTWAIDATYTPGGAGVKSTVFVTVLSFDNTPPVVNIDPATIRKNGVACTFTGTPAACQVDPGDFIEFVVTASDNKSLSQIDFTAFFATAGAQGTARGRSVLVPNGTLQVTQLFSFSVPNAFIEDVPLTALAIDTAGNRATSQRLLLRVTVSTTANRPVTVVFRDLGGGFVNAPQDVVVVPNGTGGEDVFIANGGNDNILKLAAGTTFPTVHAASGSLLGRSPGLMMVDAAGNLYFTDRGAGGDRRVTKVTPTGTATTYLDYAVGAARLRALSATGAVPAKAIVNITNTAGDGSRVSLQSTAGTTVYEFTTDATCPNAGGAATCVNVAPGSTSAQLATALAGCIATGTGCTAGGMPTTGNANITAAVPAVDTTSVVLAARVAGTTGNSFVLSSTSCPSINFNDRGALCFPAAVNMSEGHGPTFFVAQHSAGGATESVVFRYPFTFTATQPTTSNEGAYDMADAFGAHEQFGLAVRDLTTPISRNRRDVAFFYSDFTNGTNELRGTRYVDNTQSLIFNTASCGAGCIDRTNEAGQPTFNFGFLYDVLQLSDGCLLVSDSASGRIYSVDARSLTNPDPIVTLVASGLGSPRGMDVGPSGDVYVALDGADAILKIGPSATNGTACF